MPELKLYSSDWCGDCRALKRFLSDEGVSFTEIDISKDAAAADTLVAKTGKRGIPYMVIGDDWVKGYPMDAAAFRGILKNAGLL